jgi:hypothetical protein
LTAFFSASFVALTPRVADALAWLQFPQADSSGVLAALCAELDFGGQPLITTW